MHVHLLIDGTDIMDNALMIAKCIRQELQCYWRQSLPIELGCESRSSACQDRLKAPPSILPGDMTCAATTHMSSYRENEVEFTPHHRMAP